MESIDDEWNAFLSDETLYKSCETNKILNNEIPECEELYISTKTKVLFLNNHIDIENIFWEIPILEYWKQQEGIIKKQMKIVSKSPEELDILDEKLAKEYYHTTNIIKQIHNPDARRIKFKDERKITVGISKKDIMNSRGKVKNAFYNCFAIILRFYYNACFREIHVKIFNTGKLEIPGILNNDILDIVKKMIIHLLKKNIPDIDFVEQNTNNNVLINSNFNCGFFINRDKLNNILKNKYGIDTSYDPCSYPGIKCKYYFNNSIGFNKELQNGKISHEDNVMKMNELNESNKYTEVSFMIFRTGSCLIIGNCCEDILIYIYEFIKIILQSEYQNIVIHNETTNVKVKQEKIKKKTIKIKK